MEKDAAANRQDELDSRAMFQKPRGNSQRYQSRQGNHKHRGEY